MKSTIINKKVVYEPLLIEYIGMLKELEQTDVIWFHNNKVYGDFGNIPYGAWHRIESDTRIYQLPNFYITKCSFVENKMDIFLKAIKNINEVAFEVLEAVLKEHHYAIL